MITKSLIVNRFCDGILRIKSFTSAGPDSSSPRLLSTNILRVSDSRVIKFLQCEFRSLGYRRCSSFSPSAHLTSSTSTSHRSTVYPVVGITNKTSLKSHALASKRLFQGSLSLFQGGAHSTNARIQRLKAPSLFHGGAHSTDACIQWSKAPSLFQDGAYSTDARIQQLKAPSLFQGGAHSTDARSQRLKAPSLFQDGAYSTDARIQRLKVPSLFQDGAHSTDARIQRLKAPSLLSVRTLSTDTRIQRIKEPLQWSYLSVGSRKPLLGLTIGQAMARARDLYGDRDAVVSVHQNVRKTFYDLHKDSTEVAAGLLAAGLKPGDRLGIWSPNCYEWVVTQFAAAAAGLVLVNFNPSYRSLELEYCLNKVSVKGIVCAQSFKTSDYYSMLVELAPELSSSPPGRLNSIRLPHLKTVVVMATEDLPGTFKFTDLPGLASADHFSAIDSLASKVQFDEPCNIQFTSGTTGQPKGAVLSHHNILNNAFFIGDRSLYDKKPQRICLPVPLFHCFGCVAGTLTGCLYGATCVLPSAGFSGRACVEAIKQEGVTSCYGTPTMFVDILAAARPEGGKMTSPLSASLTTGIMAGAPCPPELVTAVITELGMKDFIVLYGMTETSPVSFQCYPDDPPWIRTNTIGFPSDHTEVKVVDDQGRITAVGVEGELCIRGYSVFLGYWEDEEKTKEAIGPDRWFKTGDLATIDESGYGSIRGRKKDLIIRGGENIYPAELENFFMGHPDVTEAQVFGVPDPRLGEEVVVWLRLKEGRQLSQEDFVAWCKGKIAHYKIPRHVLVKDVFPVTVTGKIQKFKMRDDTVKELGLPSYKYDSKNT